MKTIKLIIATILLGLMASCSGDSMDIPEPREKFTDTYKGEWHDTKGFSYKIGSTLQVKNYKQCFDLTDIKITNNELTTLSFNGIDNYGDVWIFRVSMSPNLNPDGEQWGNVDIIYNGRTYRDKFYENWIECN